MSLQEKLDAIRAGAKTRLPPEARAVMDRQIEELRSTCWPEGRSC